jgi:hypothetical protein
MNFRTNALFGALAVLAACASNDTTDDANKGETPDFRDGSYFYVLGYDPETGEQIRGGAHAVVGFDSQGKTEPIDSSNRVSRFHPDFVTGSTYHTYDSNLTQGETSWEVFPSYWWPQSRNGIALRWQSGASQDYNTHSDTDRLSPAEKYDALFYPGQTQVVDAVSHCSYEDSVEDPDNCERIEHPEVTVVGPTTRWELENQGVYQSVEPESWWGHCNGWASYATTEPLGYPRRDVRVRLVDGQVTECIGSDTEGCVLFRMADMEALMTELYFSDQATFSGRRCNTRPDEIERDEFGRPTEVACRDLNPGSFHVAIVGMLGRGARNLATGETDGRPAFVIDHNWDHEIWNFPIVSYRIDSQQDVSEEEASRLVGAQSPDYQWNSAAARFVQITMTYAMISDGVPAHQLTTRADLRPIDPVDVELNYVLELDAAGAVLGGEWIEDPAVSWGPNNKELHPDFIWMATDPVGFGEGSDDLGGNNDNPYVAYSNAQALLRCANDPSSCTPEDRGGGGGVILSATDLVARGEADHYDTGVVGPGRYTVTLAHDPATPGGDADLYVRVGSAPTASAYDCRPYRDGSAEVCDVTLAAEGTIFVMVEGYSSGNNHYVLTIEGEGGDGGGGEEWEGLDESGSVTRNQEVRFATPALAAGRYAFEMTGTGDADLYVRVGSAPTTSSWDCRPYAGGSDERCEVTAAAGQAIHVMVHGYAESSTFELVGFPL